MDGEAIDQPPEVEHISRCPAFEAAEQLALEVRGKTMRIRLLVWIVDGTWPANLIATPFPALKPDQKQYPFHGNSGSQRPVVNERHARNGEACKGSVTTLGRIQMLHTVRAVRFAFVVQQDSPIDDAVQECHGQGWISQVVAPVLEVDVAHQCGAATWIPRLDHLIE